MINLSLSKTPLMTRRVQPGLRIKTTTMDCDPGFKSDWGKKLAAAVATETWVPSLSVLSTTG